LISAAAASHLLDEGVRNPNIVGEDVADRIECLPHVETSHHFWADHENTELGVNLTDMKIDGVLGRNFVELDLGDDSLVRFQFFSRNVVMLEVENDHWLLVAHLSDFLDGLSSQQIFVRFHHDLDVVLARTFWQTHECLVRNLNEVLFVNRVALDAFDKQIEQRSHCGSQKEDSICLLPGVPASECSIWIGVSQMLLDGLVSFIKDDVRVLHFLCRWHVVARDDYIKVTREILLKHRFGLICKYFVTCQEVNALLPNFACVADDVLCNRSLSRSRWSFANRELGVVG
jgi:hypothetical protein